MAVISGRSSVPWPRGPTILRKNKSFSEKRIRRALDFDDIVPIVAFH